MKLEFDPVESRNPLAPREPARSKILILGLGNDLLTDDGVGLRVAGELRRRLADVHNLTVSETSEMGLSLLDLVVGFDELVLIDAIRTSQATPGFLHEFDDTSLPLLPALSPHFMGIGETLGLGRKLGLLMPRRVRIFAIEVEDPFTVGTRMTPALETALHGVVEQLAQKLCSVSRS